MIVHLVSLTVTNFHQALKVNDHQLSPTFTYFHLPLSLSVQSVVFEGIVVGPLDKTTATPAAATKTQRTSELVARRKRVRNSCLFLFWVGCRAALRHLGPAHLESSNPGPESPMPAWTSLTLSKPRAGGRVSTRVSHHPSHGCCTRQALSSARTSQAPWNCESCCRSPPPKSKG